MAIIDRYANLNIILDANKKRSYQTNMYPFIEKDITDLYVMVNSEDRLDILAFNYYGDSRYWWIIAQANNLGKGSFYIPAGSKIRIPQNLSKILNDYIAINKNR